MISRKQEAPYKREAFREAGLWRDEPSHYGAGGGAPSFVSYTPRLDGVPPALLRPSYLGKAGGLPLSHLALVGRQLEP